MRYALVLNSMLSPNVENIATVKVGNTRQELIDWYKSLLVEPYIDGKWSKNFKQGSELEWFNPVNDIEKENDYWGGIYVFKDETPDEYINNFSLIK
ncbi:hypothetical protein KJ836_02850 [Patescibacteria group bacterium]|nr:hypothetical protein [Patescibacteria group bacterium]